MKKNYSFAIGCLLFAAFYAGTGCQKTATPGDPTKPATEAAAAGLQSGSGATLQTLLAYKSSPHEIMAGFYRTYGDHGGSITQLPDSLDVAILFGGFGPYHFGDSLKNIFVPALHAKGTKVIYTGDLNIATGVPHNAAGYDSTARMILDTINKYGLDGFDIDVESNPTGTALTDMTGVYTALSKYLGPKSGSGKLLTFDTNFGGDEDNLFLKVYPFVSYVWFQSYGQGASNMDYYWQTFSSYIKSSQFVPSFSFYEENGYPNNYWNDVTYPENGTGNAYDIARWEPAGGKKGGEFAYAIDRDAPLKSAYDNSIYAPDYAVTKALIQIMNPAAAGGIVSGATYQLVSALNGTSVLDVYANGTANGTKVEIWNENSPKSANQNWVITVLPSGLYKLQPGNAPGSALDVVGRSSVSQTKVDIYQANGTTAQQWQITAVGNGYYSLTPACAPATRLNVKSGLTANGSQVTISTANGTKSQQWKLVAQ